MLARSVQLLRNARSTLDVLQCHPLPVSQDSSGRHAVGHQVRDVLRAKNLVKRQNPPCSLLLQREDISVNMSDLAEPLALNDPASRRRIEVHADLGLVLSEIPQQRVDT